MSMDLAEIQHQPLPGRSPDGHRVGTTSLKTKIDRLQAELARLEEERDRADRLMAELLKATAEIMMIAKEVASRLENESWGPAITALVEMAGRELTGQEPSLLDQPSHKRLLKNNPLRMLRRGSNNFGAYAT